MLPKRAMFLRTPLRQLKGCILSSETRTRASPVSACPTWAISSIHRLAPQQCNRRQPMRAAWSSSPRFSRSACYSRVSFALATTHIPEGQAALANGPLQVIVLSQDDKTHLDVGQLVVVNNGRSDQESAAATPSIITATIDQGRDCIGSDTDHPRQCR